MPTRRQLIQALPAAGAAFALGCDWLSGEGQARAQDATPQRPLQGHFSMKDLKIKADAGHVAWDMERFQFLDTQDEFDSIHPSLFRQSVLNNRPGTKVRGADIAQAHPYEAVPRQTIAE